MNQLARSVLQSFRFIARRGLKGTCATLMVLVGTVQAQTLSTEQQEVRCAEVAFSQTVENRQVQEFTAMLDADTRFISESVLQGPAAVTEAWAGFFAKNGPELVWRPYIVEVAASRDLALSRGPYRLRARNEQGEVIESWGIYNSVWRKNSNGQWKILFDAGNPGEQQLNEKMKDLIEKPVRGC